MTEFILHFYTLNKIPIQNILFTNEINSFLYFSVSLNCNFSPRFTVISLSIKFTPSCVFIFFPKSFLSFLYLILLARASSLMRKHICYVFFSLSIPDIKLVCCCGVMDGYDYEYFLCIEKVTIGLEYCNCMILL